MRARLALVCVSIFLVAAVATSLDYALERQVSSGGGLAASSDDYEIGSTVGQPIHGLGVSADYELCSGFWCMDTIAASYAQAGPARVDYVFTFGQVSIVILTILLVLLAAARWMYDLVNDVGRVRKWMRPRRL